MPPGRAGAWTCGCTGAGAGTDAAGLTGAGAWVGVAAVAAAGWVGLGSAVAGVAVDVAGVSGAAGAGSFFEQPVSATAHPREAAANNEGSAVNRWFIRAQHGRFPRCSNRGPRKPAKRRNAARDGTRDGAGRTGGLEQPAAGRRRRLAHSPPGPTVWRAGSTRPAWRRTVRVNPTPGYDDPSPPAPAASTSFVRGTVRCSQPPRSARRRGSRGGATGPFRGARREKWGICPILTLF